MGRVLPWCAVLLAASVLVWFLCSDPQIGAGSGTTLDPAAPAAVKAEAAGPGLKTRDAQPQADEVQEDGDASIFGLVTDEDGKPLAGLRIGAARWPDSVQMNTARNRGQALASFEAPRRPRADVTWATSEADGQFRIRGLRASKRYRVQAGVAAPFYSSSTDWTATVTRRWTLRLVVAKGSSLRGRVVDAEGAGVKAWVRAVKQGTIGARSYIRAHWRPLPFETQSDGRFTIDAVPSGTLLFSVTVLGRGARSNLPVDAPTKEEVELAFEDPSGATVGGRIVDTAGKGIAGAKVTVRIRPEHAAGYVSTTMRATTSAADGTFAVQRLTPGVIESVVVFAEGYISPGNMGGGMPLTLEKPTHLDIILARGATIEGRALDPAGQPVVGATVMAARIGGGYGGWNQQLAQTTTDATGKYVLVDVPLGPGEIKARAEGYYQPPREGQSSPYPWMPPPSGVGYDAEDEGQKLQKDVELARGRTISGTVKDEDGKVVAGVRITLRIISGGNYWGFQGGNHPVLSGADGTFAYEGLAPDKTYNVMAASETHLADPVKVAVPKDKDPEPIEIKLRRGASVVGRVTEEDGKPASGATVFCNQGNRRDVTDGTGAFEITGIKAGKWNVQVSGVNPVPRGARETVTLEAGETLDGIELTMPATLSIRGTVEDEEGKPLGGISVRAKREAKGRARGSSYAATSDTKGHFEIKNLSDGYYTVWINGSKQQGIGAGSEDVRLTYEEPERVTASGRILDPEGNPVVRGSVRIWYGKGGKRNSNASGTITGGFFRILFTTNETVVDVEVTRAADATGRPVNYLPERSKDQDLSANMEVRLTRGQAISGRVTDTAGRGIQGIQIRVQTKGKRNYGWYGYGGKNKARSDDEGHWTVKGLKEGTYTVSVTPGGDWITPEKQEADAGQKDVVIKLMKGLAISGRVLDPDGEGLAGANVWLSETPASKASRGAGKGGRDWLSQSRLRKQTGTDGTFEIKGLPERGLFHVSAGGNGQAQPYIADTVRDVAAGTKDVTLRLGQGLLIRGIVLGPDGEPIRRAWIQAQPVDRKAGLNSASANLNNKNTFKLVPLKPGRYRVSVRVYGSGGDANPPPQEVDAGARGLRFVATLAMSVTGRLAGADVGGFSVYYRGNDGNSSASSTGLDGSFTIKNVKSPEGRLFATKPGDTRYGELDGVVPGEGPYTIGLREGLSIAGFVDGLPYEPKRRAQVYAYAHNMWIRAVVGRDGGFVITGLAPGKYTVQGWMNGGRINALKDIAAGSDDVVLEFISKKR